MRKREEEVEKLENTEITESGKRILEKFKKVIPCLTPMQKERLLGISEGLIIARMGEKEAS